MNNPTLQAVPETATGVPDKLAGIPRFGDKTDVAKLIGMSKRTVDSLMARGLPHLALSKRRVKFDLQEVREWLVTQFHTSRRAAR